MKRATLLKDRTLMSVGSISFWQQDANYWNKSQARDQSLAQSAALITAMGSAVTTESQGLSSLANQTALNRVNTALTAALQSALQSSQGASSSSTGGAASSNSTSTSSGSSAPAASAAVSAPAIGTGTTPLTSGTTLLALGIIPSGTITVSDNTFTTTYTSTGKDTVGDLLNAINAGTPGNANVAAWLNGSGHLVISGKTDFDTINVGGTYAAAIGFGSANDSFSPTTPPPKTTSAPSTSASATTGSSGQSNASATSGSGGASGSTSSATASSTGSTGSTGLSNSALALQTTSTAEYLLASSGSGGSLLNMLV
jgi:hypothetical protein